MPGIMITIIMEPLWEPLWSNVSTIGYRTFLLGQVAVTCVAENHVTSDCCQIADKCGLSHLTDCGVDQCKPLSIVCWGP